MGKIMTAKELIARKVDFEKKKEEVFSLDVENVGTFKFKIPSKSLIEDSTKFDEKSGAGDEYIISETMVEPDLSNKELLEAYGVGTKIELVQQIFLPGVVATLSRKICEKAGYEEQVIKEIDTLKN